LAERRATANIDAMPIADRDLYRSAHFWIQLHGDSAIAKAREMVEAMRHKGDDAVAEVWLRIIAAIAELGAPPTDVRH
jgi:hypothetical protein